MSISFSTIIQKARPAATHATTSALRDCVAKLPPTTYSNLANGFRVACEENPNAQFATVGVFMDSGSRYETRGFSEGAAKMVELCGLQGTTNQNRQQLSKALDEIGGHLHVETQNEHQYVYIKCAKENVPKAVSFLADIVNNAKFDDADIAAAKKEMYKQRRNKEENVDKVTMENLLTCAYDSTETGLGNQPLATELAVNNLNKDTLLKFRAETRTAPRMVLVGAGAVNHTQLDNLAKEHFSGLSNNLKPKQEVRFVGGDYRLWNLRFKTCHMMWGFETCGANSGDVVPLHLSAQIHGRYHRSEHEMGQHAISRVFKMYSSIDHGGPTTTHFPPEAIEGYQTFYKTFSDTGICGMYIVGRPWAIHKGHNGDSCLAILQYSLFEWTRMSHRQIHQNELEQAKVNYKSQLLFNMDGSTNTVEDIGRQMLHIGRRVPLTEMYARIDDVTPNNVMETLQHYYFARKPVFSFNGYIYILPNYDWLQQMTYRTVSMH
jgi:predicted Zn-dependent peptidase